MKWLLETKSSWVRIQRKLIQRSQWRTTQLKNATITVRMCMKNSFTRRQQAQKESLEEGSQGGGKKCERASRRVFNLMIYFVLSSGKSGWKEKNGERRDFFSSFYESRGSFMNSIPTHRSRFTRLVESSSLAFSFSFLWGSQGSSRILIRHFVEGWWRISLLLCKVRLIIIIDEIQCVPKTFEKSPRRRRVDRKWISGGI